MADNDFSVRDAGKAIADAGLVDDVKIRRDGDRGTTQRNDTRQGRRDDADRTQRREERNDVDELEDQFEDDYDVDDAEDEGSNRDGGLEEGDEDDQGDADDQGDEGDEEGDDADQGTDKRQPKAGFATVTIDGKSFDVPLSAIQVPVKINGQTAMVSASEAGAGYQRNADYHQKTTALSTRAKTLNEGHAKVAADYENRLGVLANLHQGIRKMLIGDLDSATMAQLKREDPQQWLVVREEYGDRVKKIDAILNGLNQEYERHAGEFKKTQETHNAQLVDQVREKVVAFIPDWAQGGNKRLAAHLVQSGYTMDEVNGVMDHRMLITAEKARLWDAHQARARREGKRKVKKAPPVLKTGTSGIRNGQAAQKQTEKGQFRKARDHARKSGSMRDAAQAIKHLI